MNSNDSKIILIGNYLPDRQESMERFALMLHDQFATRGVVSEIWRPNIFFGARFRNTNSGLGKWFGYLDKWILFPIILKIKLLFQYRGKKQVRFHICDHSNSPYINSLPKDRTLITCHDVIALRGGLGFNEYAHPASFFGRFLQKSILKGLVSARKIACVSQYTLDQLIAIVPKGQLSTDKEWNVIYNPFNADFSPIESEHRDKLLSDAGITQGTKYILHVGSDLQRKNREMLLQMAGELKDQWTGHICFAGKPLDEKLLKLVSELKLENRVVEVVKPKHELLRALYNGCFAFIFPSFAEGFGWPMIEAQACGAPLIASNLQPMPEISGGAAIYANPADPKEFASALLSLDSEFKRVDLIKKGFENCERYSTNRIISQYIAMHKINLH